MFVEQYFVDYITNYNFHLKFLLSLKISDTITMAADNFNLSEKRMNSTLHVTLHETLTQLEREQRPRIGVGIIVSQYGKVLLGQRTASYGAGQWSFPGGHLKFGESPDNCVRRELHQEVGLKAGRILHGPWTNDVIDKEHHYVTLFMIVPEFEGHLHHSTSWHWFDWDALPNSLFLPLKTLIETVGLERLKTELGLCCWTEGVCS